MCCNINITNTEEGFRRQWSVQKMLILTSGLLFMVLFGNSVYGIAIDFYNDINIIFGVVQEECTNYSCPIMSAGEK